MNLTSLLVKLARCVVMVMSPVLHVFENENIKRYGSTPPACHVIFIIGAPRTGSTFLYQTITNELDVCYIDNFADMFYRDLCFGMALSQKIFRNRPHNCFNSRYGRTVEYGWHAPSESGRFWYRWIPKDQHYMDAGTLTEDRKQEMRDVVTAVINRFQKPFVFKNMNAALRMRLIRAVFPEAKFIIIHRNLEKTRTSILKARQELLGDVSQWWSLKPPGYETVLKCSPEEQVEYQIREVYKQIDEDRRLFSPENILEVHFEKFLEDKESEMERLRRFILEKERVA